MMPPKAPKITAPQTLAVTPTMTITRNDSTMKATVAPMVPMRSATSGLLSENWRTMKMPAMEHTSPSEASASGRNMSAWRSPRGSRTSTASVDAMAMVAMMAPQ